MKKMTLTEPTIEEIIALDCKPTFDRCSPDWVWGLYELWQKTIVADADYRIHRQLFDMHFFVPLVFAAGRLAGVREERARRKVKA